MTTDPQFQMLQDLGMFTKDSCMCGWPAGHHPICRECRQCLMICQDHCEWTSTGSWGNWRIPCDCERC